METFHCKECQDTWGWILVRLTLGNTPDCTIYSRIQNIYDHSCSMCLQSYVHSYWGDAGNTHCKNCHKTWPMSSTQAHCSTCHQHFKSARIFDLHLGIGGEHRIPVLKGESFLLDDSGMWRQASGGAMALRFSELTQREPRTLSAPSESNLFQPPQQPEDEDG